MNSNQVMDLLNKLKQFRKHLALIGTSISIIILVSCNSISAQEILFPGVVGIDLLNAIQDNYTPNIIYSYAEARDTLYARIDLEADSVYGIYTDYAVYLTPNTDPTVTLFSAGLNTEHIYPQGRGATDGTPAHRNMHHLAAARVNVNQDRGNLPFGEILDAQTDKWFWRDIQLSNIPSSNIDEYSEFDGLSFEPRESVKGNVARAMFYIHAIYRDQVEAVDNTFFNLQVSDLCAWHFADPADDAERLRSERIADYQDDKENPFVLDCTLAERLYCSGVGECVVAVDNTVSEDSNLLRVIHNHAIGRIGLRNHSNTKSLSFDLHLYSMMGKKMYTISNVNLPSEEFFLLPDELSSGSYVLQAQLNDNSSINFLIIAP